MGKEMPVSWTGATGHVLQEAWIPAHIRDGLASLVMELEQAAPEGLADRRRAFREQGKLAKRKSHLSAEQLREQSIAQILAMRAELLVALRLAWAGVLVRMRKDTPDFACRCGTASSASR